MGTMCTISFERALERLKYYHNYYNEIVNDDFFDDDYKEAVYILYLGYKKKVDELFISRLTSNALAG